MYVQAFGEYLFQNALHLVPTAWNAHMLSVFALDCAFVALAVGVVYGWTRSLRGAAACFAVFTGFAIAYPPIVNSDWMPYMYVLAYMVFILAAGSVAAGRAQDAWIFALTGWFLIHGHACFLFFVPGGHGGRARRRPVAPQAHAPGVGRRSSSASSAGPGSRSRSSARCSRCRSWSTWCCTGRVTSASTSPTAARAGPAATALRQVVEYALWFWWPHQHAWLAPLLGYPVALAAVRWLSPGPLRGFLLALLAVNVVSSLAFLLYAAVGIDDLTEYYIGYFYWSAPLVTVLVIVLAALEAVPRPGRQARGSPSA